MKHVIILLLIFSYHFSVAQDYNLYERKVFKAKNGSELKYRILFPENYDPGKKYPLLLFLHGSGERGDDNEKQLIHGGDLFLKPTIRESFPAMVVFPQCPNGKTWAAINIRYDGGKKTYNWNPGNNPGEMSDLLNQLIKELKHNHKVDNKRLYIMGLSMGGFGTLEMLYLYPNTFAAAVPICGGQTVERAEKYAKKVPVWLFHGAKDSVVPTEFSRNLYAKLKELGAEVKYTEFPEDNHNSWDSTFATPDLLSWIFSQHR